MESCDSPIASMNWISTQHQHPLTEARDGLHEEGLSTHIVNGFSGSYFALPQRSAVIYIGKHAAVKGK